ncbi:hypothetical protein ACQUY5_30645, partial [Bacillus cereus]|uniref:hypothetical protein n=1 Tax=Bacillus cereus TaxID=1396 RepID=UPI003D16E82E
KRLIKMYSFLTNLRSIFIKKFDQNFRDFTVTALSGDAKRCNFFTNGTTLFQSNILSNYHSPLA